MKALSAVIITFNEERNIERCLRSLLPVADELLVVDSFSTDRTVALAESLGARVIQHPFAGHIQQKNYAIAQAQHPYILSLDADEALDTRLQQEILLVKENWQADGYFLNRLTNYCGTWIKHGNWYPDRKLRLWDSRKGRWGGQNPHDAFIMNTDCRLQRLSGHLLHYSFYTFEQHLAQIKKFTDISSRAARANGKKARAWDPYWRAAWKFIKGYLLKAGFLDGLAGWNIARWSAYATYLKYRKMRKIQAHG